MTEVHAEGFPMEHGVSGAEELFLQEVIADEEGIGAGELAADE